jgi:hypothetical protein
MEQKIIHLSLDILDFDPDNPRFPKAVNAGEIDTLIERMTREERVLELMESIGEQGYFPGEPLIAVKKNNGRYFIAEGNRRLAALKLLNGSLPIPPKLNTLKAALGAARHKPDKVPCLVFDDVEQVLYYLGFRHITGVKPWRSLAKARYLKRLRQSARYRELSSDELLPRLAKEIGSRRDAGGTWLTSLAVLEYAQNRDFFGIQRLDPEKIEFSFLTTAISFENLVRHIGLSGGDDIDAPNLKEESVKELFYWLYAQRDDMTTVLGESRNLEKLAKIVGNNEALAELRETQDIDNAYRLTSGPIEALTLALADAKRTLDSVYKLLGKHRNVEDAHLNASEDIFGLAKSIRTLIRDRRDDEQ